MSTAVLLDRLDAALVGPRRVKRELLLEAADHLEDAADAYVAAGFERAEAEERAVRDFGTVDELAAAFQTTLAVAASRRTAVLLLAALSIQPFLWDSGLARLFRIDGGTAPEGWVYGLLDTVVEYGGGLVLTFAVLLVALTGVGNRWWHAGRGVARVTGWFGLAAGAFLPVTGIAMNLLSAGTDPAAWLVLGLLLVAPLAVAARSALRTLAAA